MGKHSQGKYFFDLASWFLFYLEAISAIHTKDIVLPFFSGKPCQGADAWQQHSTSEGFSDREIFSASAHNANIGALTSRTYHCVFTGLSGHWSRSNRNLRRSIYGLMSNAIAAIRTKFSYITSSAFGAGSWRITAIGTKEPAIFCTADGTSFRIGICWGCSLIGFPRSPTVRAKFTVKFRSTIKTFAHFWGFFTAIRAIFAVNLRSAF